MAETWADTFIGIPYLDKGRTLAGCDCYGTLRLVFHNRFSVLLPSLVDSYDSSDWAEETIWHNGIGSDDWAPVLKPKFGCVAVMRLMGKPRHVGFMLDSVRMLHSLRGHNSVIERIDSRKWENRVEGFYVHV